ncbi:Gamma-D-glutamyl-L-lysine endopeptidase [Legionella beliardensis]|uniref:Gamma-D-glutamyl-L-lysine endopeptidase n=1 Tax=Legionella beliardensis TaxID=91822 RepID=A0A378I0S2_9GAMM|nr:SH3 domain-containing C40 family peptidase [Legionella beliardensis]STX28265.1 Gamma-D-glutamyl-L-lysine endopeptidase [Legionella beliardensis]
MFKLIRNSFLYLIVFSFYMVQATANSDVVSLFPIEHYDQKITSWIKPTDPNYNKPLLSKEIQEQRLKEFFEHYFGTMSPWSASFVNRLLEQSAPYNLKALEESLLNEFNNEGKSDHAIGYGENFRPYSKQWIRKIAQNIDLNQLDNLTYQSTNRAIAIDNLYARALPTHDVYFYHYKIPGQGYPFDNLQESALWAGTPVYILAQTNDKAWSLVLTPDYIAWVDSKGIARTNNNFVQQWKKAAQANMAAIIRPQTSLLNQQGQLLLTAYVGAVFPASRQQNTIHLLVPTANSQHQALINNVDVSTQQAVLMPFAATPHHFARVMRHLIGRPYGWGGAYFYNDCSAELKSLFTPFGIWLPRHSSQQVHVGQQVDISSASAKQRVDFLLEHGKPFVTIIYIGGHVVLYLGKFLNPNNPSAPMAMTYQNLWGLTPRASDKREVVGGSVFFPMLLEYPEDSSLISQADKSYFQIAYLDETPNLLHEFNSIDIKSLMSPVNN